MPISTLPTCLAAPDLTAPKPADTERWWPREEIVRFLRPAQLCGSITEVCQFDEHLPGHCYARPIGCGVWWGAEMPRVHTWSKAIFSSVHKLCECCTPDAARRVSRALNAWCAAQE